MVDDPRWYDDVHGRDGDEYHYCGGDDGDAD